MAIGNQHWLNLISYDLRVTEYITLHNLYLLGIIFFSQVFMMRYLLKAELALL